MSKRKIKGLFEFPVFPDYVESWLYRESRAGHDVAGEIKYHWELAGPNGAVFFLLVEPRHTEDQIRFSAAYLRAQHDVVRMYWVDMGKVRKMAEALQAV
jgi:hypothetical protein